MDPELEARVSRARVDSPMTCRELVELVTDYLEGALSGRERERFETHIGECDPCAVYLEQIRLMVDASGRLARSSSTRRPGMSCWQPCAAGRASRPARG